MCSCVQIIDNIRIRKAKNNYDDSSAEFIIDAIYELRNLKKLSFSEWRIIAESRKDNWKIKKGQLHEVQVIKMDGKIYTYRSKTGLISLCSKYKLFPDC